MEYEDIAHGRPVVLIVDDDETFRYFAQFYLSESGIEVESAQDGKSALSMISKRPPDLVLLDVMMPGMDGFETCMELRKVPGGDRIPVLMVTGLEDIESITKAYEAGATDFVSKPVNWTILQQRMRYMLRANSAFRELIRSEARNRALLNAIPDTMFQISKEGVFLDLKSSADFIELVSEGKSFGKTLWESFPEALAGKVFDAMSAAFETRETQIFECTLSRGGTEYNFEARTVVCGESEVLVIMRDISKRKSFEEALRYSEMKYRIVADNTYAWEFWLDPGGRFIYSSPSCKLVTGYSAAEFESDPGLFRSIVHPEDQAKWATHCSVRGDSTLSHCELEYRIINLDGTTRWIGHICQPVYDSRGTYLGIRGSNRDITAQKRAMTLIRKEDERRIRDEEEVKRLKERDKILKDLHDGIGGIITNVSLLSEMALNSADESYVMNTLGTISGLSREAMSELRNFMNILDYRRLDWHSVIADMRNFGNSMIGSNGLFFRLKASVSEDSAQPGSFLCLNIYRIYKEALTNVIKHSKANRVNVTIRVKPDIFVLLIHDDGVGFEQVWGDGRGILNMKSRAEEIGGNLSICCRKGTSIHLDLPIPLKYP